MKQIRPNIAYYLTGFADGEGSFNVSFRPRDDYKMPWKVSICFNVSQREKLILTLFKRHLGCGTLRQRKDGVWYFEVNNLNAIEENVIPFFKRYHFMSEKKKRDFSKFCIIAKMLKEGKQFSEDGIREILAVRKHMNDGGKRKYSEEAIFAKFRESSETIRQIPPKGGNDIVRSSERSEVNINERS